MVTRIVGWVLLLVAGAVLGAVGTVAHQSTVHWGVDVPLGLIGALAAYTALLVGLRLLAHDRIPALAAAVGTILSVLLFAQKSAGGSVLVPDNLLGQIWLVGPILIAAVVVSWPDVSRHHRAVPGAETA